LQAVSKMVLRKATEDLKFPIFEFKLQPGGIENLHKYYLHKPSFIEVIN
jgi:hypothetical protein